MHLFASWSQRSIHLSLLLLLIVPLSAAQAAPTAVPLPPNADSSTTPPSADAEQSIASLIFEPNMGQFAAPLQFTTGVAGAAVGFAPTGVRISISEPVHPLLTAKQRRDPQQRRLVRLRARLQAPAPTVVQVQFIGANDQPTIVGSERLSGMVAYLRGNDPAQWHTNIPTYAGIVYQQLYPGIDLRYEGVGGRLKSTYTVTPGSDSATIRWSYTGTTSLRVDAASGALLIGLPGRGVGHTLTEQAPIAWQVIDGQRIPIAVRYALFDRSGTAVQRVARDGDQATVGFHLGAYDPSQPLIIDPVLDYSTFIGGTDYDEANAIALDSAGNTYITGTTYTDAHEGGLVDADVFVAKLTATGQQSYRTVFGSTGTDQSLGIAVDASGMIYLAGFTDADDFPIFGVPYQPAFQGEDDIFIVKLNPSPALIYSTYFGGAGWDQATAIAVAGPDQVYITGSTSSDASSFPTARARSTTWSWL